MATVTILGAGMMGTALCWPLSDRGHDIRLVGTPLDAEIIASIHGSRRHPTLERTIPEGVRPYFVDELPQAVEGAELIIGGVSSFGIPWLAGVLQTHLRPETPVLLVTKGLEVLPNGNLVTFPAALAARFPGPHHFNAIGGPCTAHELAARRQTAVVFTGTDAGVLERLKALFETPYYHIWTSTEVTSIEVCAAMKNAYALGVGLAVGMMEAAGPDGLALAYNPQAALFAQGCYEMRCLVSALGGNPANVAWLPGAGDLYVTVFGGRTVRLGKLLGKGMPFGEARRILAGVTLESVEITTRAARALPRLAARGLLSLADFPLLLHLDQVLNHGAPVNIPWDAFFHAP